MRSAAAGPCRLRPPRPRTGAACVEALAAFAALMSRVRIAAPALLVFTALVCGLEGRRSAMALGVPAAKAHGGLATAAWPLVTRVGRR